ncbi:MAG: hypothetical protein ACLFTH_05015 [Candidatus Woesearchaeota archaeon]
MKTIIKTVRRNLMKFGKRISNLINSLLLTAVYIVGVGITSLVARISGKRFLERGFEKDKNSYWNECSVSKKREHYYRQY